MSTRENDLTDVCAHSQVRDLMFFLEASKTVQESPDCEDIQQGAVTVGESPLAARERRRARKGIRN